MTCPAFLEWVETIPDDDLYRMSIHNQKILNQGIVFAYTGMPGMPENKLHGALDAIHEQVAAVL